MVDTFNPSVSEMAINCCFIASFPINSMVDLSMLCKLLPGGKTHKIPVNHRFPMEFQWFSDDYPLVFVGLPEGSLLEITINHYRSFYIYHYIYIIYIYIYTYITIKHYKSLWTTINHINNTLLSLLTHSLLMFVVCFCLVSSIFPPGASITGASEQLPLERAQALVLAVSHARGARSAWSQRQDEAVRLQQVVYT